MRSEARGWQTPAIVECLGKKKRQGSEAGSDTAHAIAEIP